MSDSSPAIPATGGARWRKRRHTHSGADAERIRQAAAELGASTGAVFLAALALVVARYTGSSRPLVGVASGRSDTAGLAASAIRAGAVVPLRVDVDDSGTAGDHVVAVEASLTGGQDRPARQERPGPPEGDAAVELRVGFGAATSLMPGAHSPSPSPEAGTGDPPDLAVVVDARASELRVEVGASEALWQQAELERFAEDYRTAVQELASAPQARLEEVRGISEAGRRTLAALNDTARPLPAATIDALFRQQALRTPDAVAIHAADGTLTYAELAAAAAMQAGHLAAAGVGAGDVVLVCLERSAAEIVALLGALWVGAAYVGVDSRLPGPRLQQIVALARAAGGCFRIGSPDASVPDGVPEVASWEPGKPSGPAAPEPAPVDPARLAYVAFTSGSTGAPKGIRIPHRAVVRLVRHAGYAPLGAGERMLRFAPLSFDASTFEIWGPLLNGGTLEVHPPGLPAPSELGAFLVEKEVSVAWLTSGLFALLVEHAPDSLAGVRHLLTGGDVVSPQHVAHALARHPALTVINGYGPTENTTFTTVHAVRSAEDVEDPLPIGRPVPNTTVHVLDGRGRLVPPGGVGELYTGGLGLADGYLGEDDAGGPPRFGRLSPDVPERLHRTGDLVRLDVRGRLQFLGRRDDQVKVRGFRIDLDDIRHALLTHADVRDAVVVATGAGADRRLVAAYVAAAGPLDPRHLREHLAARLPDYMLPALWAAVDELPVTATGKVDRASLVSRARPLPASVESPAATGVRAEIAAIFAEVLGVEVPAGAEDFFAMGGDSLRAFNVVGLVEERLGVAVSLRDFLFDPTLSSLTGAVERALAAQSS